MTKVMQQRLSSMVGKHWYGRAFWLIAYADAQDGENHEVTIEVSVDENDTVLQARPISGAFHPYKHHR